MTTRCSPPCGSSGRASAAQGRLPLYECAARRDHRRRRAGRRLRRAAWPTRGPIPIEDAVPLRFLGAVHRLVLDGRAPELAAFYPSAGGFVPARPGDGAGAGRDVVDALLATIVRASRRAGRRADPSGADQRGRPLPGADAGVPRRGRAHRAAACGSSRSVSSAGLNLRWDRYPVRGRGRRLGVRAGQVAGAARAGLPRRAPRPRPTGRGGRTPGLRRLAPRPDIPGRPAHAEVLRVARADRSAGAARRRHRGCPAVWPPRSTGPTPSSGSTNGWPTTPRPRGPATVVFHSIVWQYLSGRTRSRLVTTLSRAGRAATDQAPLAWVRMEPTGGDISAKATEIRVTRWPGGHDAGRSGHAGYHGQWVMAEPRAPPSPPGSSVGRSMHSTHRRHRPRRDPRRSGSPGDGSAAPLSCSCTASPAPRRTSPSGSTRWRELGWEAAALDLRGHGDVDRSRTASTATGSRSWPTIWWTWPTASGGTASCSLGHSMGGMVAQLVALADGRPGRARRAGAHGHRPRAGRAHRAAAGRPGLCRRRQRRHVGADRGREPRSNGAADLPLTDTRPSSGCCRAARLRGVQHRASCWPSRPTPTARWSMTMFEQADRLERLARLEVPVLVMVGEQDAAFRRAQPAHGRGRPRARCTR